MRKFMPKMSLDFFKEFYLNNEYDENMFDDKGNINPNYNSHKNTGLIATIIEDHLCDILSDKELKAKIELLRPNAFDELTKVVKCHNKMLGASAYECPDCHQIIFICNTCKSRTCSSCGYKYKEQRVNSILETAYDCSHRHMVFTIPEELRKAFFTDYNNCISILFQAVNQTINSVINETFKRDKKTKKTKCYKNKIHYTPGFFAFLHTFGRDLKWNPHIHVLIAEKKIANNKVENLTYFNYDSLSKRFMNILLKLLCEYNNNKFLYVKNSLYKSCKNGFYVYAEKKKFSNFKQGIEYVTRYCGRVPISENRIVNYDGKNVTFSYIDHTDNKYYEKTVSAKEFILLLIRHIPPKQFKIIRYYGFYRKKPKCHDIIKKIVDDSKKIFRKLALKYENSIVTHFNRNPFNCPRCNTRCVYVCNLN